MVDVADSSLLHDRTKKGPAYAAQVLREEGCRELDDAIALCLRGGLSVVVDCHPRSADWVRPDAAGRFANLEAFWTAVAPRLAGTDPDRVFLEILNEPHELKDPATWPAAQARLAAIIREKAPRHTIIATGDEWGGVEGLARLGLCNTWKRAGAFSAALPCSSNISHL